MGTPLQKATVLQKKNFYVDIAGGITISYEKVMLSWTQVIRTEEFKGQRGSHSFGALALSYYFPFD